MKNRKYLVLAALAAFLMISSVELSAGDPIRKLGRGICNVAFGVCEVPLKIYYVNQEDGGLAAVTYGPLKGVAYCVAREVVGVIDIVTFPMPLPGCPDDSRDTGWGYGPIMRPEWIFTPYENPYNIIYQDTAVMD